MYRLINKLKIVFLSWAGFAVAGGLLITLGMEPNSIVITSLVGFTLTYCFGVNRLDLPITSPNNQMQGEAKDFVSSVDDIKNRAVQLYLLNDEISGVREVRVIRAYRQALLKTISDDNWNSDGRIIHFSLLFKENIAKSKNTMWFHYNTFDKVILDLIKSDNKTDFQKEFLSYITWKISKNSVNLEELSFGYKVSHGQLLVRKLFNNWLGYKILSYLGLVDSNIEKLGATDILNLQLPSPNNRVNSDG